MYNDLIKALRETDFSDGCPCGAEPMCQNEDCIIAQAADAIEELSKPKWIPVTERLPEVRTWVLCYCRANSFDVFRMTDEGNWQYGNRSIYMKGYVTHWMPLPPAPKEE